MNGKLLTYPKKKIQITMISFTQCLPSEQLYMLSMLATDIKNKVSYKQLLIQHLELRIEPHTN